MVDYPEHNMAHNPGPDDPMDLPEPMAEDLDREEIAERMATATDILLRHKKSLSADHRAFVDSLLDEGWLG